MTSKVRTPAEWELFFQKQAEAQLRWRLKNPEKVKQYHKNWVEKNSDKVKEYRRKYNQKRWQEMKEARKMLQELKNS